MANTITNKPTGKKDYFSFDVDCPYKDKCSSRGIRCNECGHNKNKKDDYFVPRPYRPWTTPQTPYIPFLGEPNPPLRPRTFMRCCLE